MPQMLQIALVFVPSNRKYPFTYALHLEQRRGEFTRTLWTRSEPNGVIQTPRGKLVLRGVLKTYAEVGLRNSGPAS